MVTAEYLTHNPIDALVGAEVTQARTLLKLSVSEVAQAIGFSEQSLQDIEDGRRRVSAAGMMRLASELRVPISFFFRAVLQERKVERGPEFMGQPERADPSFS